MYRLIESADASEATQAPAPASGRVIKSSYSAPRAGSRSDVPAAACARRRMATVCRIDSNTYLTSEHQTMENCRHAVTLILIFQYAVAGREANNMQTTATYKISRRCSGSISTKIGLSSRPSPLFRLPRQVFDTCDTAGGVIGGCEVVTWTQPFMSSPCGQTSCK